MKALKRLYSIIQERSGLETLNNFLEHFQSSGYEDCLNLREVNVFKNLTCKTPETLINQNGIINHSRESLPIAIQVNLDGSTVELKALFELFVLSGAHVNPIGHFRNYPEYYSRVFSGARYFAFHGDGNCFAISMIFHGLLKKLNIPIEIYHGSLPNRRYMHSFCMDLDKEFYIDPDQKTFCSKDQIKKSVPKGFIYSLLSFAGFNVYKNISSERRQRLFSSMTADFFKDFDVEKQPEIYEEKPSLRALQDNFQTMFASHIEQVSLEKNDYPWKQAYRQAVEKNGDGVDYFFSKLDRPYVLDLPSFSEFQIGNSESLPEEIFDFECVFFGRVPGIISQKLSQNNEMQLSSPEIPWMVAFEDYFDEVILNEKKVNLLKSNCGRFGLIGMGDLEKLNAHYQEAIQYKVKVKSPTTMKVIFPINIKAFESGLVQFKHLIQ